MKYIPLPMKGPLVLASLADAKTQTRRTNGLEKFQHAHDFVCRNGTWYACGDRPTNYGGEVQMNDWSVPVRCPYGQPGDRIWVREAWRALAKWDDLPPRLINPTEVLFYEADAPDGLAEPHAWGKLRPPMFMPRWACRLVLEVTGIRVERLQDISQQDAAAEGCEPVEESTCCGQPDVGGEYMGQKEMVCCGSPDRDWDYVAGYRLLWEQINGPGSWDLNPWVWAVSFRRVT